MKKVLLPLLALGLFTSPLRAADAKPATEKFYGKVMTVDASNQRLTVHNKKQKSSTDFRWNGETKVVFQKKPIAMSEVKPGQSLIVSFARQGDTNMAKRITVRAQPASNKNASLK